MDTRTLNCDTRWSTAFCTCDGDETEIKPTIRDSVGCRRSVNFGEIVTRNYHFKSYEIMKHWYHRSGSMGKMNQTGFKEKRKIIKLIFSFSNAHENGVIQLKNAELYFATPRIELCAKSPSPQAMTLGARWASKKVRPHNEVSWCFTKQLGRFGAAGVFIWGPRK